MAVTPVAVTQALLLARTVRLLRPEQVAHRLRLRTQRGVLARVPQLAERWLTEEWPLTCGWPAGFVPLDGRVPQMWPVAQEIAGGRLTLLGQSRSLGEPRDWAQRDAPALWRFHLHYWDWAWSLALHPNGEWARGVFSELYRSWRQGTVFGRGDAWSPYVASLRAWTFCGVFPDLVAGTALQPAMEQDLRRHAGFLKRHVERDVGGNHLLKNLKALAGVAVFAGDDRECARWERAIAEQVGVQVLPDGGHYERSPAYHCQVLADLRDVAGLLKAVGRPVPAPIDDAIGRMRAWLGTVLLPDGTVPMLNDGFPVPDALLRQLRPSSSTCSGSVLLPDSGIAVLRSQRLHLICDVGPPCPDELPAHAHADSLSFLLLLDDEPVLVDTGSSTYEPGPRRAYERSTAAHSTVTVDGADSTEVWGTFRAARRARPFGVAFSQGGDGCEVLTAAHDGFRRLPGQPLHRRIWTVRHNSVVVEDSVSGSGSHLLTLRFHLSPRTDVVQEHRGLLVRLPNAALAVTMPEAGRTSVVRDGAAARVGDGFGRTPRALCITHEVRCRLPATLSTVIQILEKT